MMTPDFHAILQGNEYDFLRTDPHLKNRIALLVVSGSHAYGTNTEGSDVDIRGVAMNRPEEIIGYETFEQFCDVGTDTTVFSSQKVIKLLAACNPNTIEMLGCKPEHYLILSDFGKALIENRRLFLSQRAIDSFGGYADAQLRRLENAVARDRSTKQVREEYLKDRVAKFIHDFPKSSAPDAIIEGFDMFASANASETGERETRINLSIKNFPMRDLDNMSNGVRQIIKNAESVPNTRSHKKDDKHLNKHAMHLVRLYFTGIDILEKGDIITYREKEHDLLMDIRNGKFMKADGTYNSGFYDLVNELFKRFTYAAENTNLPEEADKKAIQEMMMCFNRRIANEEV